MTAPRALATTLLPLLLGLGTLVYSGVGHVWARSYAGDAFAVAFVVGLLGLVTPASLPVRLGIAAALALAIEFSQLIGTGSHRGTLSQLLVGSHFDTLDLLYYGAGLLMALALDMAVDGRKRV